MAIRTTLTTQVPEKASAKITAVLKDEDGNAISSANLDTLTLTLYKRYNTSTIINSRSGQDVLNVNNVTVDTSGNLTWLMQVDDNIISDTGEDTEDHIAIFQWTYSSGTKAGKHEILITVLNLDAVT